MLVVLYSQVCDGLIIVNDDVVDGIVTIHLTCQNIDISTRTEESLDRAKNEAGTG